jgi:hypothetical protein
VVFVAVASCRRKTELVRLFVLKSKFEVSRVGYMKFSGRKKVRGFCLESKREKHIFREIVQ